MATKNTVKRYYRIVIPSMGFYLISLFGFTWLNKAGFLTGVWSYGLAIIPGLCVLWFMWGHYRYLQECDELHRKVHSESMLIAMFMALGLATMWGLLEMTVDVPAIGIFWMFPLFYGIYGLTSFFISRRYGVSCLL